MQRLMHVSQVVTSTGPKRLEVKLNSHEPFNVVVTLDGELITEASRDRIGLETILDIVKALDDKAGSKSRIG